MCQNSGSHVGRILLMYQPHHQFLLLLHLHHHGQDQKAAKGCQGRDSRSAQGWNRPQDHQLPSVWSSIPRWDDHEKGAGSAPNYCGGTYTLMEWFHASWSSTTGPSSVCQWTSKGCGEGSGESADETKAESTCAWPKQPSVSFYLTCYNMCNCFWLIVSFQ